MTSVTDRLEALQASAARLATLTKGLTPDQLETQSYPKKWSISDVLSHIGSGAVIMRRGVDAAVSGRPVEDGFNQSVWDEWNTKRSADRATEVLVADQALIDRLAGLSDDERAAFKLPLGPFELDLATAVGLRLNEHVLHTWDIDVALDPAKTLPADASNVVIDNLAMIIGWAGKTDGDERDVVIRTSAPERTFALKVGAERLVLEAAGDSASPTVEMPAESFIRLVYGRLDPDHTPAGVDGSELDRLRRMFPGF
jgi:uncharacterized protein (TIGR03083 family)